MDGVTIGHYTCASKYCQVPLSNVQDRYCALHAYLEGICSVEDCQVPVEQGFKSCSNPHHWELETLHIMERESLHQHRQRIDKLKLSRVHDSLATAANAEDAVDDANNSDSERDEAEVELDQYLLAERLEQSGAVPAVKRGGARRPKVKTRFTRRSTHNEQLVVRPCGVIIGRATMFHAEAFSAVKVSNSLLGKVLYMLKIF